MNDRKQHVINKAHQLFIEKGFQATSIQDILDYSGISKGTFYKYFSSKSELLIAIYKAVFKQLQKDRNDLLIGKSPSDIEVFIKQIELQMISNRKNKLIALYEEVSSTNDADLKQYIRVARLRSLRWMVTRFIDIFDEKNKPYLLDCAIMFQGLLQNNLQYNRLATDSNEQISNVVRYSVNRLVKMVKEVAEADEQLHQPELLEQWLPSLQKNNHELIIQFYKIVSPMRNSITKHFQDKIDQEKFNELLDFIQEEIMHTRAPRKFLIESALQTLLNNPADVWKKELLLLNQIITVFFQQLEENEEDDH
ncbi:TetR/AcrR family transcriptional regulator [Neobacillus sp. DY30]|uniref:TetR/AcrR family transcriptional regulator n=1 Tax=Neobacillus sp. DY30 TaxID=3047871 RepID=UPI0024C04484|nr:TetR/AcrR family transcriptional regulator [Neobacillus sp. DY30]WHX98345.1 TetR/AcrR family transcriptional regulator [Neobacillus sp. DY30]